MGGSQYNVFFCQLEDLAKSASKTAKMSWKTQFKKPANLFKKKNRKSDDTKHLEIAPIGVIGQPFGVTHKLHVGFDPTTGDFNGLPEQWRILLDNSLSKAEQSEHPDAALNAVKYYAQSFKKKELGGKYIKHTRKLKKEIPEGEEDTDDDGLTPDGLDDDTGGESLDDSTATTTSKAAEV